MQPTAKRWRTPSDLADELISQRAVPELIKLLRIRSAVPRIEEAAV
jgi:hypothetical protein